MLLRYRAYFQIANITTILIGNPNHNMSADRGEVICGERELERAREGEGPGGI